MNDFITVNIPLLNGNEKKFLNDCIDTGWISSEGPFVRRIEGDFAKLVNKKFAIMVAVDTKQDRLFFVKLTGRLDGLATVLL